MWNVNQLRVVNSSKKNHLMSSRILKKNISEQTNSNEFNWTIERKIQTISSQQGKKIKQIIITTGRVGFKLIKKPLG